jgi:hypothetical protein
MSDPEFVLIPDDDATREYTAEEAEEMLLNDDDDINPNPAQFRSHNDRERIIIDVSDGDNNNSNNNNNNSSIDDVAPPAVSDLVNPADDEDGVRRVITHEYEPVESFPRNQIFADKEEASIAIQEYARRNGFKFLARKSAKLPVFDIVQSFSLVCSRSGLATSSGGEASTKCPVVISLFYQLKEPGSVSDMMVEKIYRKENVQYYIKNMKWKHNHLLHTDRAGVIKSAMDFTYEMFRSICDNVIAGVSSNAIRKMLINNEQFNIKSISDMAFAGIMQKARRKTGKGSSEFELKQLMDHLKSEAENDRLYWDMAFNGRSLEVLLFATPAMIFQLKRNGQALIMDCTYKTNRFDMVMLLISCVDENNRTAITACALMGHDDTENTKWVFDHLRKWAGNDTFDKVQSISTDGASIYTPDLFKQFFPNASHFRCRFHLWNNIKDHCLVKLSKARKKDFNDNYWHPLYDASTESEYNIAEQKMKDWFITNRKDTALSHINYLSEHVFSIKELFVDFWVNQKMHLGCLTTSRAESMHARIKSFDINSKSTILCGVHTLCYVSSEQSRRSSEIQLSDYLKAQSFSGINKQIAELVTGYARDVLIEEASKADLYEANKSRTRNQWFTKYLPMHSGLTISRADKDDRTISIINNKYDCSCTRYITTGLPCCHIMKIHQHRTQVKFQEDMVHNRWKIRFMPREIMSESAKDMAERIKEKYYDINYMAESTNDDKKTQLISTRHARHIATTASENAIKMALENKPDILFPIYMKTIQQFVDDAPKHIGREINEKKKSDIEQFGFTFPANNPRFGAPQILREAHPREGLSMQRSDHHFELSQEFINHNTSSLSSRDQSTEENLEVISISADEEERNKMENKYNNPPTAHPPDPKSNKRKTTNNTPPILNRIPEVNPLSSSADDDTINNTTENNNNLSSKDAYLIQREKSSRSKKPKRFDDGTKSIINKP